MSGDLGGVFWSYVGPPNSHIIKHIKQKQINNRYKHIVVTVFVRILYGVGGMGGAPQYPVWDSMRYRVVRGEDLWFSCAEHL